MKWPGVAVNLRKTTSPAKQTGSGWKRHPPRFLYMLPCWGVEYVQTNGAPESTLGALYSCIT